jgi:ABC-type uncharacterized transport system permease subunit
VFRGELNLPHGLTALLYAALTFVLARALARRDPDSAGDVGALRFAPIAAFALHTWALAGMLVIDGALHFGAGTALSAITWLSVLIYGAGGLVWRLEGMLPLILPVASVACLAAAVLPPGPPLTHAGSVFFEGHLVISIAAYSLFTIASVHALLMAFVERRLHSGRMPALLRHVPPLMALEAVLFKLIAAGFVLLTATLASGLLFSETLFGRPLELTQKIVFGFVSWLIFGGLLAGRAWRGWRGHIAVRWTLAGFAALVVAYVGARLAVEVVTLTG